MHPTDIFVQRPVLATVVNLIILILGVRGLLGLNIRQFPESSSSVITITTPYIGASADVVRGFITTPLEQVIASADGIDYLESTSNRGVSTIAAHLQLNYEPNDAVAQILTKVNQVRGQLPEGSEEPQINVTTGSDRASMYIAFTSNVLSPAQVTDYLSRVVRPQLETIPGVQSAQILGGRVFAMRIWLNPERMAALGVTPTDVRAALGRNNVQAAIGDTENQLLSMTLNAETELHSAEQFRQLVVRAQNQAIIRLGDIANVVLGAESYDSSVRLNGIPSTAMAINVVPTANPLRVIAEVKSRLPALRDQLPKGLEGQVVYDATVFIERSIIEVVTSLATAVAIVIGVIFLSLGTIRSALVPTVTIPLAMVGTGTIMFAGGFSINLITLLALVLAIGVIVDDAIVVVEIVYRRIQAGAAPMEAARLAGRELLGPVIAMNVVIVAVFTPVALQGGLTGSLFGEFAFTVMGAAVLSGIIGLTLSPMMSGKLLDFQLRAENGALIPASTFVSLAQEIVPRQLKRFAQLNAAILAGVPAPGVTSGEALDFLAQEARAVFPDDFRSDYAGLSRQFVTESGALLTAFGLAIVLIYLILAAQFESFRDPLLMLITVPMSTVGALAFIVIAGASINIYTQIGLITLMGAISKHGILIVEYARQVEQGDGVIEPERQAVS